MDPMTRNETYEEDLEEIINWMEITEQTCKEIERHISLTDIEFLEIPRDVLKLFKTLKEWLEQNKAKFYPKSTKLMLGADQNEAKFPNINLMNKKEKEQYFHEINFQARKTKDAKTKEN